MELEVVHTAAGDVDILAPRGEIDLATQGALREAFDKLILIGRVDIVVDLGETTFLDSTGLGALISARRRTHGLNGSFAIVCANPRMRTLFEMTRLDLVFRVHESYEDWAESRQR